MRRFNYLFMAGLMTLGLWSCSDDANLTPEGGEGQISADKVYMSFKLELPTASRSATDDEGDGDTNSDADPDYEVGSTSENNVGNLVVVLAETGSYKFITNSSKSFSASNTMYTVTFESDKLEEYVDKDVCVLVFCNHPAASPGEEAGYYQGLIEGNYTLTGDVEENIAKASAFWMASSSVTTVHLPSKEDLSTYNTEINAFSLGTVSVERTAARFDYQAVNDNKYVLEKDASNTPIVEVQLTDIALVNMSTKFNYLRRVSAIELTGSSDVINVCVPETPTSYVVDADYKEKINNNYLPNNYMFYWANALDGSSNITNPVEMPTVIDFGNLWNALGNKTKKMTEITSDDNYANNYKIWRYSTENTLPTKAKQIKSLSTAVLFKGKLIDNNTGDANRLSGDTAYVFNNTLYGTWAQVYKKIKDVNHTTTDAELIALKLAHDAAITSLGTDGQPTMESAAQNGFTVYVKDDNGTAETTDDYFPVYYYYINKHNTDTDDNVLGTMEFAVVRNNVYKLSVTNISKFGHPSDPTGDPDPENPTDPDETEKVYFTVSVKVLPWVVRVNDIEF